MKKLLFCLFVCTSSISQASTFTENFTDLSQWGPAPWASYAHVIADPTGGSGNVLAFTSGNSGGDIFSKQVFNSGVISFDYFGPTSLGQAGGYVGFTPINEWLAGTGLPPGSIYQLSNTGAWIHYSLPFTGSASQIGLEQFGDNTPDQALFRNLSISPVAAVPEPGTYGLMLMGLGMMGFVGSRRKKRSGELSFDRAFA